MECEIQRGKGHRGTFGTSLRISTLIATVNTDIYHEDVSHVLTTVPFIHLGPATIPRMPVYSEP